MKLLPGCSSETDLEAPSVFWSSMCPTHGESDFYTQNQNPFSWHSWCQSFEGTVQDSCLCWNTQHFHWKFIYLKQLPHLQLNVGVQTSRKPAFFFRPKAMKNVMWPFFLSTDCLWEHMYLLVCCHLSMLSSLAV